MNDKHFYSLYLGFDAKSTPHLLKDGHWLSAQDVCFDFNGAYLRPVLGRGFAIAPSGSCVTGLAPLLQDANGVILFSLAHDGIFQVNFARNTFSVSTPGSFVVDTKKQYRWTWTIAADTGYAANFLNYPVKFATGSVTYLTTDFKAKYICEYQQHMFCAHLQEGSDKHPLRVRWSDYADFADFTPVPENNSDFIDLPSDVLTSVSSLGITGLATLGEFIFVFTVGSIFRIQYVGFNAGVMQYQRVVSDVGSWLPYSVVGFNKVLFFISRDNIWAFDGVSISPIGDKVRDFFFKDLTTTASLRNLTWGFVDTCEQRVCWRYTSVNGEESCLVYDPVDSIWTVFRNFNVSAFLLKGQSVVYTINDLSFYYSTINSLDAAHETIKDLDKDTLVTQSQGVVENKTYGFFQKAELSTHEINASNAEAKPTAVLETGALTFGHFRKVKTLHRIRLDISTSASLRAGHGIGFFGWKVEMAKGEFVSSEKEWKTLGIVGASGDTKREITILESAVVFWFRFTSVDQLASTFLGFTLELGDSLGEK
jgi:hypothetical protein